MNETRTSEGLLQRTCSALRDCVPEFRSTEVNIVNTEEVHILDVPSERCSPHPEVEIWRVDAR